LPNLTILFFCDIIKEMFLSVKAGDVMGNNQESNSTAQQAVTLTEETRKHRKPRKRRKKAITHIDELKNRGLRRIIEEYSRDLTRKLAIYIYTAIALISFTFMLFTMCDKGYEGYIGGMSIGVAPSKAAFEKIKTDLNDEIVNLSGSEEGLIETITYKFRIVSEKNYTTNEDIRRNMVAHSDAILDGWAIYVDGVKTVTVKTEGDFHFVLSRIQNQYNPEGMECESKILNEITTQREPVTYSEVCTIEQAIAALNDAKATTRDYIVVAGDSLWGIAHEHDLLLDDFLALNPEVKEAVKANDYVLRVGDVLQIPAQKPIVDVVTVIPNAVIEEAIPCEMILVDDYDLYVGKSKITDPGQDGWRKLTATITRVNGVEDVSKRIITKEPEIINEPRAGQINIGKKPIPRGVGSGPPFKWPLNANYTISSRFGPRWGSTHTGLDMALPTGNDVLACDEGVVVFAGWNKGGYGNLIKIDHKNGYQTWYAHLSKIYVRNGDIVSRGEIIGAVGNTGFSTGPHLHLEVRVNGVAKNPENFKYQ